MRLRGLPIWNEISTRKMSWVLATLSLIPCNIFHWALLVPPTLPIKAKTHHARYTGFNYPHFFRIRQVRSKLDSDSVFSRATTLWGNVKRGCFLDSFQLRLRSTVICIQPLCSLTVYLEWLLGWKVIKINKTSLLTKQNVKLYSNFLIGY